MGDFGQEEVEGKPTCKYASPTLLDVEGGDTSASLHSNQDVCLLLSLSPEAQRAMVVAILVARLRSLPVDPLDTWHRFPFEVSFGLFFTARFFAMVNVSTRKATAQAVELFFGCVSVAFVC